MLQSAGGYGERGGRVLQREPNFEMISRQLFETRNQGIRPGQVIVGPSHP
jgi:hypothetical protein